MENNSSQQSADSVSEMGKSQNPSDEQMLSEFAAKIEESNAKWQGVLDSAGDDNPSRRLAVRELERLEQATPEAMLAERKAMEEKRKRDAEDDERRERQWIASKQDHLWRDYVRMRGSRYQDCRIKTFEIACDKQQRALDQLRHYYEHMADNLSAGKNIVLFGPSGTGKDHLLTGMVHCAIGFVTKAVRDDGITSISGPSLFAKVRQQIADPECGDIIKDASQAWLLVVNDLVPPSAKLTDFQSDVVYRIIDHRYNWRLPTFLSINVRNRAELDAGLGVAVADRIIDGALTISCDWPSYRKADRQGK